MQLAPLYFITNKGHEASAKLAKVTERSDSFALSNLVGLRDRTNIEPHPDFLSNRKNAS